MVVDEDIILVFLYNENGRRCFDLHMSKLLYGWMDNNGSIQRVN